MFSKPSAAVVLHVEKRLHTKSITSVKLDKNNHYRGKWIHIVQFFGNLPNIACISNAVYFIFQNLVCVSQTLKTDD